MSSALNEAQRLRILLDLNLLDSAPEERFDRLTRMAARLFGVPMAFVSLVDADRLWFKSRVGFPYAETPSAQSFCLHAIRQEDALVVCDARQDERFAASPYVTAYPEARFYAGQPLAVNGAHIGTLCLVDSVAREFGEEERALLRDLATLVANEAAAGALAAAEARARRGDAALRTLLEHLPDCVLLLDDAGVVLSCNPAAERLLGREAAQLTGQPAAALLGIATCNLLTPGPGAGGHRCEGHVARAGGALTVEAVLSRLEIEGRTHLVASVRDVSSYRDALERERAQEARRRAYFRTATHELRTPMASILGFSELLLKRDFDAATGRELLGIIHKQSTRLVALINQMLDLARIEGGGPEEQQRAPLDLHALAAAAIGAATPAARASDVRLETAPGLPPVSANGPRLQQALAAILDNAVRFSTPGSAIVLTLAGSGHAGRPGLRVTVRDHGTGMRPEQQARMFEAFYRTGDYPEMEGAGLGLVMVREIVAGHGGHVAVESRPGAGTAVTLWLPAAEAP